MIDNVSHFGNVKINSIQSEILCGISDTHAVLKRSKQSYRDLSREVNKIGKSKDCYKEHPNMMNLSGYEKFFCNKKNKAILFQALSKIVLYDDEEMSGKLSYCTSKNGAKVVSNPVHIVEIPEELSNPIVCFSIPNGCKLLGAGERWKVNSEAFPKKTFDSIIQKLLKYFVDVVDSETLMTAVYYQHHEETLFVKVQILNVVTGGANREKLVDKVKSITNKKGYDVFVPKYHEFPYTNIHLNSNQWYLSSLKKFEYDREEDEQEYSKLDWNELVRNPEDSTEFYELFSCNSTDKRVQVSVECDPLPESEEVRDLKQEVAISINNNREFAFDDVILAHIPTEHWVDLDLYETLIREYSKNKKFLPILEYHSLQNSPLHNEHFTRCVQMSPLPNRGFYPGLVKSTNGFRNPNFSKNSFNVNFCNVIKNFITLKMSESANAKSDLTMLTWGQIGKKVFEGKYYRVSEDGENNWYYMGEKQDDCAKREILKWIKGERASRNSKAGFSELYSGFPKFLSEILREMKTDVESQYGICELSTNISAQIVKAENNIVSGKIAEKLYDEIYHKTFMDYVNSDQDVFGVPGGVVHLDLYSDDPKPRFYKTYTRYILTKSTFAEYMEMDWDNEYVKLWMKILKEIFKELTAMEKILMRVSTKLDGVAKIMQFLFCIAGGSNAKSVFSDAIHICLADYSGKYSSNLITGEAPKEGKADPDMAQTDGHRGGYIAETKSGETLNDKRIKQLTEESRIGRALHKGNKEIKGRLTTEGYSNFALGIDSVDGGTDRRLAIYHFKNYFLRNPDPEAENEFKINRDYENLPSNPKASSALLAILIHYRIRFRKEYKDNWDAVPCPVIEKETQNYKKREDKYNTFVSSKIVRMEGFNMSGSKTYSESDIMTIRSSYDSNDSFNGTFKEYMTLPEISAKYKAWYRERFSRDTSVSSNDIENFLLNTTKLKKYFIEDYKNMGNAIMGVRYIHNPENRLKEEIYIGE